MRSVPNALPPVEEIKQFLLRVRVELTKPGRFELIPRSANLKCLADLGLTVAAAISEIMSLTYHDYYQGPSPDDNTAKPGDVWVFVKRIDGIYVYIKLKLDADRGCVCLSFHEPLHPFVHPY